MCHDSRAYIRLYSKLLGLQSLYITVCSFSLNKHSQGLELDLIN